MKKILFILNLLFCSLCINARCHTNQNAMQLALQAYMYKVMNTRQICAYFDGYWSEWLSLGDDVIFSGSYSSFVIYQQNEGPWDYFFKVSLDEFKSPDKKSKKKHIKSGEWYEYTGKVEFYISDDNTDIYEIFKKSKRAAFITKKAMGERPVKRIVRNATIRVKPYKRKPQVYNIFFDKVGVGINFGKWQFL